MMQIVYNFHQIDYSCLAFFFPYSSQIVNGLDQAPLIFKFKVLFSSYLFIYFLEISPIEAYHVIDDDLPLSRTILTILV
jgi:hypothetical protein